jgi:Tol biopolymer transport system component/DNA-binding winged helix-turn-helix (wHTH) protein
VAIRGHAAKILAALLEHPGEVVTREELRKRLWPGDTFVDFEHILNNSINKLREAFCDEASAPRYIQTLPGLGYRFIASIDQPVPSKSDSPQEKGVVLEAADPEPAPSELGRNITLPDPRKGWNFRHAVGIVAGVVLVAGLVFVGSRIAKGRIAYSKQSTISRVPANLHVVPVTKLSAGSAWGSVISPDGEKVAFFWDGETLGKSDEVYVQMIDGEKPLRLTRTHVGAAFAGANWSPDGQKISFARCDDKGGSIFAVPVFGGPERKLTDITCNDYIPGPRPVWTPDGDSLILDDPCEVNAPPGIVVVSLRTSERRCLDSPPPSNLGDGTPRLSPDGRTVAFLRFTSIYASDIYTIAVNGGELRRLTNENSKIMNLMWTSDGQRIVFDSLRAGLPRVWRVPATGGVIEPDSVYPWPGSMSRDGRRLVYDDPSSTASASPAGWRAELSSAGGRVISQEKIITSNGHDGEPQPSPDGREIAFGSTRSGNIEIWKSKADGSDPQQITFFKRWPARAPRWSPDGKWLAFDVEQEGYRQIYLMDSDGRNQRSLTSGNFNNQTPTWSRDGTAVYFASIRVAGWQVWKRELATGRETQVTGHGGYLAIESYDGKTLYYSRFEEAGLWKLQLTGGEEEQITSALSIGAPGYFAVAEAGLYLLGDDSIMYYDFQTHKLKPVLRPKEFPVTTGGVGLGTSRDGRTLFMVLYPGGRASISMVENFQ